MIKDNIMKTIRISKEHFEIIQKGAKAENRSLSNYMITCALNHAKTNTEEKNQLFGLRELN